jgi:uncharacterized protein YbbK (DUF523 family)
MKKILVSECLYGGRMVRYDAGDCSVSDPRFLKWKQEGRLIPICAEVFGGCPVPRPRCYRVGDKITDRDGNDFTREYIAGAKEAVRLARENNVVCCIMKENSPSCGGKTIFHPTLADTVIPGHGLAVEYLRNAGFVVFSEHDLDRVEELIETQV